MKNNRRIFIFVLWGLLLCACSKDSDDASDLTPQPSPEQNDPSPSVEEPVPDSTIDLPEESGLTAEDLTILGDGSEVPTNDDGTFSSIPASVIALNQDEEIVYLSYGSGNEERVLGPMETAVSLLLPTVPNVVTDFDAEHLHGFKIMVALLPTTLDLAIAIKESIVKYGYLKTEAIQSQLAAAVRELHHRCGLDKEAYIHARNIHRQPKSASSRPEYPFFKASDSRRIYWEFITIEMTSAQMKEKDGEKYWSCTFDAYNDNRFCYTSITKAFRNEYGFYRYDDSWADTFRYLLKPYNLSECMDLGLISDIAYDPLHFIKALEDYDYSKWYEDEFIARLWQPFDREHISTYDKTVKRDIAIDFYTANEHLYVEGPGRDGNLLLFNIIKIGIQPMLKMYVKAEKDDLDKFTEAFMDWISTMDLSFRADLLQHFKDPNYSMWEKFSYAWDKISDKIEEFVLDKTFEKASEWTIKCLFDESGVLLLKSYKKIMDMLKTGYKAGDIFQFILDSQFEGFGIEIEQGYEETDGFLPIVSGSDF